jgi:hypothetical protein
MGAGVTTSKLPCHYVDYLCNPGLKTRGGIVPLQMYMGKHTNGEKSAAFLDALFGANLADLDNPSWTPRSCVPENELLIMRKGQGNDAYYVKLWDWIWVNQEQLGKSSNPILRDVYNKYFNRMGSGSNPLYDMVKDAYFGNECIGFVSNYLRYIKVWNEYRGVDNHRWSMHFPQKIQRLEHVRSLDLLEWTNVGHIALVDDVDGVINGQLKLDISQCSGFSGGGGLKGPMSNRGVFLSRAFTQGEDNHTKFTISGAVPVTGDLQVRRMPGLQYNSPRYPYMPETHSAEVDAFGAR